MSVNKAKPITNKDKNNTSNTPNTHIDTIQALASTMQKHHLTRISYKNNDMEVALESMPTASYTPAQLPTFSSHQPIAPTTNQTEPAVTKSAPTSNQHKVQSPLIGVIYLAPSPTDAPFIKVGDKISKGQTLFIVECMKTMNRINATEAGVVKEILVKNENLVEYNQDLAIIETDQ